MAAALSATADADARLERARTARHTLADGGIHLAGIRHHSPGCARAVASLIEQVRPAVVLIEGPDDLDSLLPSLADPATVPPIAWNSSPWTLPGSGNGELPARICRPGAVTSGLMMSSATGSGPRDENSVMLGAARHLVFQPVLISALGLAVEAM